MQIKLLTKFLLTLIKSVIMFYSRKTQRMSTFLPSKFIKIDQYGIH